MRAAARPIIREVHLSLDEDDLWALMHEAVDDWKAVIGLKREDSVLAVTHVDHCPGKPNALVRICLSLQEEERDE